MKSDPKIKQYTTSDDVNSAIFPDEDKFNSQYHSFFQHLIP